MWESTGIETHFTNGLTRAPRQAVVPAFFRPELLLMPSFLFFAAPPHKTGHISALHAQHAQAGDGGQRRRAYALAAQISAITIWKKPGANKQSPDSMGHR